MRILSLVLLAAAGPFLVGCTSVGDSASDVGSSVSGGFTRNADTYGTQRRVDVYGGTTAPTLPTMGATGFGK